MVMETQIYAARFDWPKAVNRKTPYEFITLLLLSGTLLPSWTEEGKNYLMLISPVLSSSNLVITAQ